MIENAQDQKSEMSPLDYIHGLMPENGHLEFDDLAVEPSAVTEATKKFRVSVTMVPSILAQLGPVYVSLQLGTNWSPNASALLNNFVFTGGAVTNLWMNAGSRGDFKSGIQMKCRAGGVPPQVLGSVTRTLQGFSFDIAVTTNFSKNDWFSLWLFDQRYSWFPSSASGAPGLFASVSWTQSGQFTCAAYQGNGRIGGRSDVGFGATVAAL